MVEVECRSGIGVMAARYNVSFRTLRFYEQQGLLQPEREGLERFYTAKDEVRLRLILRGKRFGFTLQEIGRLIGGATWTGATWSNAGDDLLQALDLEEIVRQIDRLEERKRQVDEAIRELQAALDQRAVA